MSRRRRITPVATAQEPAMSTRPDPRPPRALSIAALLVLFALCLGIVATSQSMWSGPALAAKSGL
ncbi:hypothetical protein [Aliiroseovarius sp.]|uniref:hypothetical protein n=1 Tax=Aliiroseovarius sp. TaxID=1872442 RepID=UPI00260F82E0|nr:hypothetical protein [Aliiroseovarius sp.]